MGCCTLLFTETTYISLHYARIIIERGTQLQFFSFHFKTLSLTHAQSVTINHMTQHIHLKSFYPLLTNAIT